MSWSLFGKKKPTEDVWRSPELDAVADPRDPLTTYHKPRLAGQSLAKQLAAALNAARKPDSPTVFAQRIGLPVLTVKRFCAGQAMKIQALEKLATGMGWTISVTDKDGKEVVHL